MAPENAENAREDGISREEARALEEDFHGRLRGKIGALREVFNPLNGRVYFVDPSVRLREWDEKEKVKQTMLQEGVLDRSIRRRMPSNRATRLDVGTKGILSGFTPLVSVVGISLSPIADLAVKGWTRAPVEFPDLEEAVKRAADRPKVFHYVGVFTTTSFTVECQEQPPRSKNLITLLVERGEGSEWKVLNDEGLPWRGAEALFDLETISEKLDRCVQTLLGHAELRMKGGHVALDEMRGSGAFPEEIFDRALAKILEDEEELQVREIDGIRILQRSRF